MQIIDRLCGGEIRYSGDTKAFNCELLRLTAQDKALEYYEYFITHNT